MCLPGASVADDATRAKVGTQSVKFTTNSGTVNGVNYPAAANAHWDLTGKDQLSFWLYAVNSNSPQFQGGPDVVLRSPGGEFLYQNQSASYVMDTWRLYQIPLAGGGPWALTTTGSPTLSDGRSRSSRWE